MNLHALYDLTDGMKKINEIFEAGEIDEQEYEDTKESFELIIKDEIDAVVQYQTNIDAMNEMLKKEIDRLKEKQQVLTNRKERIKQALLEYMQRSDIKKIDTSIATISRKKNAPSVIISKDAKVPAEFITTVMTEKVDKNSLKNVLKKGKEIEGISLVSKERIEIK